jgi:excisionase family DNA binding protein
MSRLYTPSELAERLRVPVATLRTWVARGQLPVTRLGVRTWRVDGDDLERFLQARRVTPVMRPPDEFAEAKSKLADLAQRRAFLVEGGGRR